MARIKLVYLGGGSTRAAGTMASFMANGADFDGSEVVLVDLDEERLELIRRCARRCARPRLDIAVSADHRPRAALEGCDAVLSSFRPAASRHASTTSDPLEHGLIGQETQGPAGSSWHSRDHGAQGRLRRDGGALPGRLDLQLHEPGQHRRRGRITHTRRSRSCRSARGRSTSATTIAATAGSTRRCST
jgi:hypothetical protein